MFESVVARNEQYGWCLTLCVISLRSPLYPYTIYYYNITNNVYGFYAQVTWKNKYKNKYTNCKLLLNVISIITISITSYALEIFGGFITRTLARALKKIQPSYRYFILQVLGFLIIYTQYLYIILYYEFMVYNFIIYFHYSNRNLILIVIFFISNCNRNSYKSWKFRFSQTSYRISHTIFRFSN